MQRNNFDLVRLILALTVCAVHAYELSRLEELEFLARFLSSQTAVQAFFVISGFLIIRSYERSSSLMSYCSKRIRRIYPAYAIVVIGASVVLALISHREFGSYFGFDWLSYVFWNLIFLNFVAPALPGVFDSNYLNAVNGALWTIKIEVMFYASVPIIVMLIRRYRALPVLGAVYGLSLVYHYVVDMGLLGVSDELEAALVRQLPGQMVYFAMGALFHYYYDEFRRLAKWLVLPALVVWLYTDNTIVGQIVGPAALAFVVLAACTGYYLGNFGRYGDFSYGVYILHFPIIQTLVHYGVLSGAPLYYLALSLALTGAAAFLLWHIAEKRWLHRSSHYIVAETGSESG